MSDANEEKKELDSDIDHSKNPLQAWKTMRRKWSNTQELKNFGADFEHWNKTSEGKEEVRLHNKKSKEIREFFTEKNIKAASAEDFKNIYGKLYARRIDTVPNKPEPYVERTWFTANGGLENFRSKLLEFITPQSHNEKFEYGVKNIKGFADATASEILCDMFPQDCFVWNNKVQIGIQILKAQRLVPKERLEGKKLVTAEDYKEMKERIEAFKDVVSNVGITDYLELDHFFWYVASRNYWRIQPGWDKEFWDVFQNENIIAMDYAIPKDLTGYNQDKITEIVKSVKKEQNEKRGKAASQLNDLANQEFKETKMKIGDYVIINNGQSEILGSCVIRGDYKYDKTKPCPHTRKVEYLSTETKEIPKQDWGTTTSKKLDDWKEFNDIISGVSTAADVGTPESSAELEKYTKLLEAKRQIVLYGPPGTGKTYRAKQIAAEQFQNPYLEGKDIDDVFKILHESGLVELVQFHPSYAYEDFVEGIRPYSTERSDIGYKINDGIFSKICKAAEKLNDGNNHYFALVTDFKEISNPFTAERRSSGGGMNTLTKSEFKKILSTAFKDDVPEAFENIDNFKIFYRLNTKKDSKYGDIDGSRYHFSESAHGYKQFLENIQNNDVAIAYHDRTRDGFFGVGIIHQSNYVENPKSVLIIDEINRGNLSKIFGELIYGLEYRDEKIKTQYSEFDENPRFLKIPKNLLVIGTMNTADRSISLFDTALRRRFSFMELLPDYDLLTKKFGLGDKFDLPTLEKQYANEKEDDIKKKILSLLALNKINEIIADEIQLGREKQIGHSYLLRLAEKPTHFDIIWKYDIIPLLEEFFYAESNKLENILTNKIFDSKKGIQDFDADELIESLEKIITPPTENG